VLRRRLRVGLELYEMPVWLWVVGPSPVEKIIVQDFKISVIQDHCCCVLLPFTFNFTLNPNLIRCPQVLASTHATGTVSEVHR
jgi:hypothetical protein